MIDLKMIGALGLGAILLLAAAYETGVNAERKRGEAAALRTELATAKRDQAIAELSADSADQKAAELAAMTEAQEKELDALKQQLAAIPVADRDLASAAALDRLYGK
jgi:hypothetical protein